MTLPTTDAERFANYRDLASRRAPTTSEDTEMTEAQINSDRLALVTRLDEGSHDPDDGAGMCAIEVH